MPDMDESRMCHRFFTRVHVLACPTPHLRTVSLFAETTLDDGYQWGRHSRGIFIAIMWANEQTWRCARASAIAVSFSAGAQPFQQWRIHFASRVRFLPSRCKCHPTPKSRSARRLTGRSVRGALVVTARAAGRVGGVGLDHIFASASRFRKAASPASDTSTHFLSGADSASCCRASSTICTAGSGGNPSASPPKSPVGRAA
jgi:hypothetical protein